MTAEPLEWRYPADAERGDDFWNGSPVPTGTPVVVRPVTPAPGVDDDPLAVDRDVLLDMVTATIDRVWPFGRPDDAAELAGELLRLLHPTLAEDRIAQDPGVLFTDAREMVNGLPSTDAWNPDEPAVVGLVTSLLRTIRQLNGEAQRIREAYSADCRRARLLLEASEAEAAQYREVIREVRRSVRTVHIGRA